MRRLPLLAVALTLALQPLGWAGTVTAPQGASAGPLPRAMFAPVGIDWGMSLQLSAENLGAAKLHPIVADMRAVSESSDDLLSDAAALSFSPVVFHLQKLYTHQQFADLPASRRTAALNTAAAIAQKQIGDRAKELVARSEALSKGAAASDLKDLGQDLAEIRALQRYASYVDEKERSGLASAGSAVRAAIAKATDAKLKAMLASGLTGESLAESVKASLAQQAAAMSSSDSQSEDYKALMEALAQADEIENGGAAAQAMAAQIAELARAALAQPGEGYHALAAAAISSRLQKSATAEERNTARKTLAQVGIETPFATARAVAIDGMLARLPAKPKAQAAILDRVKAIALGSDSQTLIEWVQTRLQDLLADKNPIQALAKQLGEAAGVKAKTAPAPAASPAAAPAAAQAAKADEAAKPADPADPAAAAASSKDEEEGTRLPTPARKKGLWNWVKNNQIKTAIILAFLALFALNAPKFFKPQPVPVNPPTVTQPVTPDAGVEPDAGTPPDAGTTPEVKPDTGKPKRGHGKAPPKAPKQESAGDWAERWLNNGQ